MKLWQRTVLIVGVALVLLVGTLAIVQGLVVSHSFAELERRESEQNVRRALRAIETEIQHLDTQTHDWAAWDDTYAFAVDHNQAYVDSNLGDATMDSNSLNLLLIVDSQARVVFAKGYNLTTSSEITIPEFSQVQLDPELPLLRLEGLDSSVTGVLMLQEGPMLVASRPIVTSLREGPLRGALVMGRFLDDAVLQQFSAALDVPLTAVRADERQMPADVASALATLQTGQPYTVSVLDARTVAGYALLRDIAHRPALVLKATLPREIYRQGQGSFQALAVAIAPITVAFSLVILAVLWSSVVSRVTELGRQVARVGQQADLTARVSLPGKDEVSQLAAGVNEMLGQLQRAEGAGQRRQRYVEALAEAAQALLPPLAEISYEAFLRTLGAVSGATRVNVYLLHREPDGEVLVSEKAEWRADGGPYRTDNPRFQRLPLAKLGFERWLAAFERGEAIAGAVAAFPPAERALLEAEGVKFMLALPLIVDGIVEGFLGFDQRTQIHAWDATEVDMLRTAAAGLSQALKRKQEEHVRDAIYRISEAAHSSANLEQLYRSIHAIVGELMPAQNLYIALQDQQTGEFSLPYRAGTEQGGPVPRKRGGLTAYVLRTAQPLLASREVMHKLVEQGELDEAPIAAHDWLGVPLKVHDKVIGVLSVHSLREGVGYGEREKSILSFVSTQIAMAIERKRAEEALWQTKLVVERSPVVLFRWRAEPGWPVEFVSENVSQFGYTAGELLQDPMDYDDLVHPDDRARLVQAAEQIAARGGEPLRQEYRLVTKDGQTRWVEERSKGVRDGEGRIVHFEGIILDITEKKAAEAETAAWQQRYELTVASSGQAVYEYDLGTKQVLWGGGTDKMLGYGEEEMVHGIERWGELVHPEDRARAEELLEAALQKRTVFEAEYRMRHKDGHYLWIRDRGFPVFGPDGKPQRLLGMNQDITQRKLAEEQRDQLEAQLRDAQKMQAVGMLAGGVAHDFNNLLTVVLGNTELALEQAGPSGPLYPELLAIQKTAKRAAVLTQQLLAFGRRQILRPQLLDPNELVNDLAEMLRRMLGELIEVRLKLTPDLGDVLADRNALEQALVSLAVNSRDAMPEGGTLTIETGQVTLDRAFCEQHPGRAADLGPPPPSDPPLQYARIGVEDTGVGMDADTLQHLFEPFFTTKEQGKGQGLGLAVVYGIIKQHNGWMDVQSAPGQGTRFEIYLPVQKLAALVAQETVPGAAPHGQGTILLAEDEDRVRDLAERLLQNLGYQVLVARDGLEALETFLADPQRIDLAILDAVMPRLSGTKAFEQMRALRPELPVLFVTGYNPDMIGTSLTQQAGVHVLQKPFTIGDLGRMVKEALGGEA